MSFSTDHKVSRRLELTPVRVMLLAGVALAAAGPAAAARERTEQAQELVQKRTLHSSHYLLPDGTKQAVITQHPQHYYAGDGSMRPIIETVQRLDAQAGPWAFGNSTNLLATQFAADRARVQADDLTFEMMGMRYGDGATTLPLSPAGWSQPRATDNQVTYTSVFPGVDVVYTVRPGGLTKEIYLRSRPSVLDRALPGRALFEVGEKLALPEGSTLRTHTGEEFLPGMEINGGFQIMRADGKAMIVASPFAQDEMVGEVKVTKATPASYRLEQDEDGSLTLWTGISAAWLADPSRRFPVMIDPTLDVQPDATAGKDSQLYSGSPASNWGTRQWITDNFGVKDRGIIEFNLTSIPAASTVSTATLSMFHEFNTTGQFMNLYNTTATWAEATVSWASISPSIEATSFNGHVAGPPGSTENWDVKTPVQQIVNGTRTNFGWQLRADDAAGVEQNMLPYFRSSDDLTPGTRPRLVVVYVSGGACCAADGTCSIAGSAGACVGTYKGDGTTCSPDPCLSVSIAAIEAKLDDGTRFTSDTERTALSTTLISEINANEVKINALETKLDDGTRFTNDVELGAVVVEINANETKIDLIEAKMDTLLSSGGAAERSIEDNLAHGICASWMYRPNDRGGNRDELLSVLQRVIDYGLESGCPDAKELERAQCELDTAEALLAESPALDCKEFCARVLEAYKRSIPQGGTVGGCGGVVVTP